jgi:uncharacterized membrane protein
MFLTLEKPVFLTLCLLVPGIWLLMSRSFARGRSSRQKVIVFVIRSLLIILLGLALCEPQLSRHSDQVNVFFCLDVSESIPRDQKRAAEAFINAATDGIKDNDQAGLIAFGKHPSVEVSLGKDFNPHSLQSDINPNYTNIHDALQLAIGKLPPKGKNKIVVFSDGNETLKHSLDMASLAGSLGIEIYAVPLATWFGKNEAFIKELNTPSHVALETPFEIRLVVISSTENHGELILIRNEKILAKQSIELQAGINVLTFVDTLIDSGLYKYKAVANFSDDTFYQNNEDLSFTRGTQKTRILYLSDDKDRLSYLADALRVQGLNLDHKRVRDISGTIHGLVDYNAIIFDNISGRSLSYSVMEHIEKYVKDLGGGLIMIGGDKSFGAGYYRKTPIEKALPVFMDVPSEIRLPDLCLIFVIDKSSSMASSYWGKSKLEMAKMAAFSSIEILNPVDSVGIVTFDTEFGWIVPITKAGERQKIADQLSQVIEGGGTDLYPALQDVQRILNEVSTSRKHVIVLSDGQTEEADFQLLVQSMRQADISVSTVAIGSGADIALMDSIAQWGNGRAYYTDDPRNIPKIFTGETKIITQKIIAEKTLQPILNMPNEITRGIDDAGLPIIRGQVVTYPKPGANVFIGTGKGPLLAAWQYGLGRSVAFTSDLANRWGKDWIVWEHYSKFAAQMVKWAQRKETQKGVFATIDRRGEDGIFTVDVTADNHRFVNHLDLNVTVLLPAGDDQTFSLNQVAPGRYESAFPAEQIGAYFFSVFGNDDEPAGIPRVFGFGIPHTDEFSRSGVNEQLLEELASKTNGRLLSIDNAPTDLFTGDTGSKGSGTPLWPFFVLAFLLLLVVDVVTRKLLDLSGE